MFVEAERDGRLSARTTGDERRMLADFLTAQRTTLEIKCSGLEAELPGGRWSRPRCRCWGSYATWPRWSADGSGGGCPGWTRRRSSVPTTSPTRTSTAPWPTRRVVAEAWRRGGRRSRSPTGSSPAHPTSDVNGKDSRREPISLREVLVHMVEEYARHNGHADLLRERIDGAIGV